MKTRVPEKRDVPAVEPQGDGLVRQVRHYKLITPLFGGGVTPGAADPITIVRGTEVRGQLRFWWRATRGGQFDGNLERMRHREEEIWGSAAAKDKPGPSVVHIAVKTLAEGTLDRPFEVVLNKKTGRPLTQARSGSSVPAYAAFPLQPEKTGATIGMQTAAVRVGVEFSLEVCYPPEMAEDVRAALWAWETFGGLGARTRRGFGALQLVTVNGRRSPGLPSTTVEVELRKGLAQHVVSGQYPTGVPHLTHDLRLKVLIPSESQTSPSMQVWKRLIGKLQDFRQTRHKRMGLSLWPEANEIRHKHHQAPKWPPTAGSCTLVHKFPRAAFGQPVVYHLPHDKHLPVDTFMLQGRPNPDATSNETFERLASVLILKPFPCAEGQAVGIAAVLAAPRVPPYGLEIKEIAHGGSGVEWQLTRAEAATTPIRKILHGETDVIEAFLKSLDPTTRR